MNKQKKPKILDKLVLDGAKGFSPEGKGINVS